MDYDNEYERMSQVLHESWDKMSQIMFESSDINVKKLAQGFCDEIERYDSICKRRAKITSSVQKKPIKSGWFRFDVEVNMKDGNVYHSTYEGSSRSDIRKDIEDDFPNMRNFTVLRSEDLSDDYVYNSRKPIKSSKQIKDGDKITPEMAKKFTGWINDFQPINTTFSYDLRRMIIEKGIGVSFTPDASSSYQFIIDPNRFDEWLQLAKRFCINIDTEFIKKRLNSKDTNQFVGCRIYL